MNDPYLLTPESIANPPKHWFGRVRHLGPGFILSAAIVGSGELIATTTLGARAGFVTFWVVLVSCLMKVMIQIEVGKYTVLTGKTAVQIIQDLPGIQFRGIRWSGWLLLVLMFMKMFQMGGILGGVVIIITMAIPTLDIPLACLLAVLLVVPPVVVGYYKTVERLSLFMISLFTVLTFAALYFLKYTHYSLAWPDVLSGIQFHLPAESVVLAMAAFGITGVSGEEIIYYNYWCLEKGYARFTGPCDHTDAWKARAKGWIATMKFDAIAAMVVYTTVTAAFYLLGAAVLYSKESYPQDYKLIETLASIYVESLGPEVKVYFLMGAFMVLLSTAFSTLASWTRLFPDLFGMMGWIDFYDLQVRRRMIIILGIVFPVCWSLLYLFVQLPLFMVLSGGLVGAFIMFLIAYVALYLRLKKSEPTFREGLFYDLPLFTSACGIFVMGGYALWNLIVQS